MTGIPDEMELLTPAQRAAVERVIVRARAQLGRQAESLPDGDEAYAYQSKGTIHWGLNSGTTGWCVARGMAVL
jgi:hypothetical protein